MKSKLWVIVSLVAIFGLAVSVPAGAKPPLRGDQAMVLNVVPGQCPDITWFGTIDFVGDDHSAYGMALYGDEENSVFYGNSYHYEEEFAIFTELFVDGDEDGVVDDCDPGEMVLSGSSSGVTSLVNSKFHSTGVVEEAHAPFADWNGRHVHQDGVLENFVIIPDVGPVPTSFVGSLRLN